MDFQTIDTVDLFEKMEKISKKVFVFVFYSMVVLLSVLCLMFVRSEPSAQELLGFALITLCCILAYFSDIKKNQNTVS